MLLNIYMEIHLNLLFGYLGWRFLFHANKLVAYKVTRCLNSSLRCQFMLGQVQGYCNGSMLRFWETFNAKVPI